MDGDVTRVFRDISQLSNHRGDRKSIQYVCRHYGGVDVKLDKKISRGITAGIWSAEWNSAKR